MAPPCTVGSVAKATTCVPFARPTAASTPRSSSGVIVVNSPSSKNAVRRTRGERGSSSGSVVAACVMSCAPEDEGDVVAAETE